MGIPNVVYPLFIWIIRSLQISHEAGESTNAISYGIDKLATFDSRISHCPAECLGHELNILSLIVRVEVVTFLDHVVYVIDRGLGQNDHCDGHNCADDCHNDSGNLDDGGENFHSGFHNDTSKYLF